MGPDPYLREFYWIGTCAMILTPAPDLLSVLSCGLRNGRDAALVAALAAMTVLLAYAAAAVLGIGFLVARYPVALVSLRWLAIFCLLYLAYEAVAPALRPAGAAHPPPPSVPESTLYGRVLLGNVVNPKFSLFFFAMLQYAAGEAHDLSATWIVDLIVVFVIGEATLLILIAVIAGWIGARRQPRPRPRRIGAWVEGLLHVGLALSLAAV